MIDKISLSDPDGTPKIDLEAQNPIPLSDNAVADRTAKFSTAFPQNERTPSHDDIKTAITTGKERDLRVRLSTEREIQDRDVKMGMVKDLARYKSQNGGDLTDAEQHLIFNDPDVSKYHPDTILEQEYGRNFMTSAIQKTTDPNHPINVAQAHFPGLFHENADVGSEVMAKSSLIQTVKQNNDATLSNEGWLKWGGQLAESMVPFVQASHIAEASPDAQTSRFLPGTMLQEQAQALWAKPLPEFNKSLQAMLEPLNAMERSQVLDYLSTFSGTTKAMSDINSVFDAQIVVPAALKIGLAATRIVQGGVARTIAYKGAQDIKALSEALKDSRESVASIAKSVAGGPSNPQNVVEKAGDIPTAARIGVIQRLTQAFPGAGNDLDKLDLVQKLPSIFNFTDFFSSPGNFSREATNRLMDGMISRANDLVGMLKDARGASVNRLNTSALGEAFKIAEAEVRDRFTGPSDAVLDVRRILFDQDPAQVNRVELRVIKTAEQTPATVTAPKATTPLLPPKSNLGKIYAMANTPAPYEIPLGRPNATFFESPSEATAYAEWYNLREGAYSVEPQGNGYYLSIKKAVNETHADVRNLLTIDTENQNPVSFSNALFGRWKSAEDVLPELQRANRKIALLAPNKAKEALMKAAAPLIDMGKKDRGELQRLASAARDMPNLDNPEARGYFFKNVGDFEQGFIKLNGHPPTEAQADAFMAYQQLSDFDYFMRNFSLLRDKERQGIEQVLFHYHDGQQSVTSPFFEGRKVDDLPWDTSANFSVLRTFRDGKPEVISDRSQLAAEKELIKEGKLRVIQVAHPPGRPLAEIAENKNPIHFVLTENIEAKQLSPQQIKYNPGGHSIYEKPVYVKQPWLEKGPLGRLNYLGDKNIFNFGVMAKAEKIADMMDEARLALKAGREGDVADILSRGIPMTTDQFKNLFKENGFLSLDHPIVPVRSEQRAMDGMYQGRVLKVHDEYGSEKIHDEMYSPYNLYNSLDKEFLQDRDAILPTIRPGEREGDPLFKLSPSKQIDPFAALQRGLGGAIRQRWMNDYKTGAIEQWIAQFSGLFAHGNQSYVKSNPLYFFYHPPWKESTATYGDVQRANAARDSIVNFLGNQSDLDDKIDWVRWKMADGIYNALSKYAPKYGEKFASSDFVTNFLTPGAIDPARWMRGFAFHITIGMFNPMRYFLHAFYASHVLAVAGPTNAWKGMAASGLIQYMTMHGWTEDEALINHTAGMASRMGFGDPEHFKEMYSAMRDSGWGIVGNETAWKQDMFNPQIFKSSAGKFLDSGTWFFRKGEQFARLSAFGAAYKEWKAANPVLELTNKELGKILNRADNLSLNMTRASLAGWQRGLLSVPTQFATYNVRLLEQLLPGVMGKSGRISAAEAWRAVATYGVLFGIPATVGGVTGFPAYESVQKAALDRGIDLHSNWKQLFSDGLLSSAISIATGHHYNVAERYGPNADKLMYEALDGDKQFSEVIAGPSGAMIADMAKAVVPGLKGMWDWATDTGKNFPVMPTDALDALRRVGGVSQAFKFTMAAVYGKYYSRADQVVANVDGQDALWMGIAGLTPSKITDATLMQQMLRDNHDYQSKWEKLYITDFQRAIREFQSGDSEAGQQYLRRANADKISGDFSPKQVMQIQRKAMSQEAIPGIMKTRRDFWMYSPESRKAERLQMIQEDNK